MAELQDLCAVCEGIQGPDHVHVCAYDGRQIEVSETIALGADGEPKRLYCGLYCAKMAEPEHPVVQMPEERWEAIKEREELKHERDVLKARCLKAGVPWA